MPMATVTTIKAVGISGQKPSRCRNEMLDDAGLTIAKMLCYKGIDGWRLL